MRTTVTMQTTSPVIFALVVFAAAGSPMSGQAPPVISLQKLVIAEQTEPETALVRYYLVYGVVAFPSVVSGIAIDLSGPTNRSDHLMQDSGTEFTFQRAFALRDEFDAQYPNGTYTIQFSGARTASYAINVAGALPEAPIISNFAAAQRIPNGQSFTLSWVPLPNGAIEDYVYLQILSETGAIAYDSGGMGAPFALNGLSRQARFTLPADRKFIGKLNHMRLSQGLPVSTVAPVLGGMVAETVFPLRTMAVSPAPVLTSVPRSQHVVSGSTVSFSVKATADTAISYQWSRNGLPLAGETRDTLTLVAVQTGDMGFYSVLTTASGVATVSDAAVLTVETGGSARPGNISARAYVPAGGDLTPGFVIAGARAKTVLVRAVGPGLTPFGVSSVLADPKLEVIAQGGATQVANDDWSLAGAGSVAAINAASAAVGAFALTPDSPDAAAVVSLAPGAYTVRVTDAGGGGGIVLVEVYDTDSIGAASRLINVSTRAFVGTDVSKLVSGFVVAGTAPRQLLIRAIGPGLAAFGVSGFLNDPQLTVVPLGQTTVIGRSDNWGAVLATTFRQAGAFALPDGSLDAALVLRLPPGGYTVEVSGKGETTGTGLVEVYDLDP